MKLLIRAVFTVFSLATIPPVANAGMVVGAGHNTAHFGSADGTVVVPPLSHG